MPSPPRPLLEEVFIGASGSCHPPSPFAESPALIAAQNSVAALEGAPSGAAIDDEDHRTWLGPLRSTTASAACSTSD